MTVELLASDLESLSVFLSKINAVTNQTGIDIECRSGELYIDGEPIGYLVFENGIYGFKQVL